MEDKSLYENIRLNKAFNNYKKIVDKKLPYKFSYLDEWMLKSSNLLLKETNKEVKTYKTYKRGTIVKADFGVNMGSEMSQVHFAIVLSKNDNPRNNVLTVLPLTSKSGKFNLCLKTLVADKLVEKLEIEEKHLQDELKKIEKEFKKRKISRKKIINKQENIKVETNKLLFLINYYKKSLKISYGCTNLITTISKTRLLKPINEYDIIGKALCPSEVLDIIDKDIIQKLTNSEII